MQFIIEQDNVKKRLDAVVSTLSGINRSQLQKLIRHGMVTVNGSAVKTGYDLRLGDVVEVTEMAPREIVPLTVLPIVIDETDEYIVINKPSGLTVHPAAHAVGPTLVDWLSIHYPETLKVGDDPMRPGIVHRLDKAASGVMVVARTQDSFESLKRQFKLRQVEKEYMVLAEGKVSPEEGDIDFAIRRSKVQRTKFVASADGKQSSTHYVVDRYLPNASLVRVTPSTGRTHQLRVHFYAKGNPLIGDPVYHRKDVPVSAERLMLHAYRLAFANLKAEKKEYSCEPDASFQEIVERFSV